MQGNHGSVRANALAFLTDRGDCLTARWNPQGGRRSLLYIYQFFQATRLAIAPVAPVLDRVVMDRVLNSTTAARCTRISQGLASDPPRRRRRMAIVHPGTPGRQSFAPSSRTIRAWSWLLLRL